MAAMRRGARDGFVSAPRDRRTSRDSQYLFVNRRFRARSDDRASLSEGYRSILPHGVYPAALLFIETPLGRSRCERASGEDGGALSPVSGSCGCGAGGGEERLGEHRLCCTRAPRFRTATDASSTNRNRIRFNQFSSTAHRVRPVTIR
jgi:hypothetical protein